MEFIPENSLSIHIRLVHFKYARNSPTGNNNGGNTMARAADASSLLTVAISRAIRERRLSLGVSQEELGNRADLHRTYISDIEAGRRNLSLRSLFRLALGLGLSVSDLLKLAEVKTESAAAELNFVANQQVALGS